ncbi:zf-TFIIB domain-containing protein [uncultured Leifsonia sp.]|uniref:zf-TFIIB domain-containing protein n=1 Tax=uncultured Leifsonia sp. TaxID=340359 RepID=UPI0025E3D2B8|nr:zf-TFIIB domain-containing protein [uncultured Leifsonia sp.]
MRGVWLDRGELDKIIDRAQPAHSSHTAQDDYRGRDTHARRDEYGQRPHTKKRENRLSELFD